MRKSLPFLLLSAFILLMAGRAGAQSVPDKGKWSGRMSLTAGGSYTRPKEGEKDFPDTLYHVRQFSEILLKYDRRAFGASLQLTRNLDRRNTDGNKVVYTRQSAEDFSQMDVIARRSRIREERYDARTDLRWSPSDRIRLSGFVSGSFRRDTTLNTLLEMKLVEDRFSLTNEEIREGRNALTSGFRGEYRFVKGKLLTGVSEWRREWNGKQSHWYGVQYDGTDRIRSYRLTPYSSKDRITASLYYRDSTFAGVSGLLFEPGVRMTLTRDTDQFSGATRQPDGSWQDSLRIRETFDFMAVTLEPYARADYKKGNLTAYLEAGLQLYGTRLDNDTLHQALTLYPVKPVGRLGGRWELSARHTLFWSGSVGVVRPAYQQICWYPRQGAYQNQLFIGNPDLLPTQVTGSQMGYRFQYKPFFAEFTSSYSRRDNEVVRTFDDFEEEGRKFKVFTWVNAARTRTWIEKLTLGWNGTAVKGNVSCLYHDLRQKQDPTDKMVENRYWEWSADAMVLLPFSWTLSADVNYHTKITTLYQIIDPYLRLNARVQKKFGPAWTLFLEGRDLLDKPLANGVISGLSKQTWLEETRQNRRLIQIGAVWQF
ncbi:MAG: outer membrane beta-barrel protein [Bacteroidales bacterium]|nr:outer membrane beta-barrel protein [Bacteroidales bacterium]